MKPTCILLEGRLRPVIAMCSSKKYNLSRIVKKAQAEKMPIPVVFPSPQQAQLPRLKKEPELVVMEVHPEAHVAVFAEGALVSFGLTHEELHSLTETVLLRAELPPDRLMLSLLHRDVVQEYTYTTLGDLYDLGYEKPVEVQSSYVDEGPLNAIVLENHNAEQKLPFIYCLAESVQIEALNRLMLPVAQNVKQWKDECYNNGSLPLSLREARVNKARLLRIASKQLRLCESRPLIFWEGQYNHLRHVYNDAYEDFEVGFHNGALRTRVSVVQSSLGYLGSEVHKQISRRLEWIIIWLIVVEFVTTLCH